MTIINSLPTVGVVLSSYNGETYICEQINSILNQTYKNLHLFIRDDGSSDNTVALLKAFEKDERITCIYGENKGVIKSFYTATEVASRSCDYVAFSDQDDYWLPNKIERAVNLLETKPTHKPALYCSEYLFCDENLNPSEKSRLNDGKINLARCLYENKTSGNTILMNKTLTGMYLSSGCDDVSWHDWWVALIAYSVGTVVFDNEPTLLYRRTGSNVSPTGSSPIALLKYRINYFLKSKHLEGIKQQINKLSSLYGSQMDSETYKLVSTFTSNARIAKAVYPASLRQNKIDELALRLLLLAGLL